MWHLIATKTEQFTGALIGAALGATVIQNNASFGFALEFTLVLLFLFFLQQFILQLIFYEASTQRLAGAFLVYLLFTIMTAYACVNYGRLEVWREGFTFHDVNVQVTLIMAILYGTTFLTILLPLFWLGVVNHVSQKLRNFSTSTRG